MPEHTIPDRDLKEFTDWWDIYCIMLAPNDEKQRTQVRELLARHELRGTQDFLRRTKGGRPEIAQAICRMGAELIMATAAGMPDDDRLAEEELDTLVGGGIRAGLVLIQLLRLAQYVPKWASIERAKAFVAKSSKGSIKQTSVGTAWTRFRAVAHLWAAAICEVQTTQNALGTTDVPVTFTEGYSHVRSAYSIQPGMFLPGLLGIAECFRARAADVKLRVTNKQKGEVLPDETTWAIRYEGDKAEYTLNLPDFTDDERKLLRQYRARSRYEKGRKK